MAEITSAVNEHRKVGIRKMKKHHLQSDMTPMVDLGFLLITFFVITTELNKPVVTKLVMPDEGGESLVGETDAITVLLTKNNTVYYYEGQLEQALAKGTIRLTSLSYRNGIGDVIREKQLDLDVNPRAKEGRKGLMLIIKPHSDASYSNVIDMLDEVMINDVQKYVMTKPGEEEVDWLLQQ